MDDLPKPIQKMLQSVQDALISDVRRQLARCRTLCGPDPQIDVDLQVNCGCQQPLKENALLVEETQRPDDTLQFNLPEEDTLDYRKGKPLDLQNAIDVRSPSPESTPLFSQENGAPNPYEETLPGEPFPEQVQRSPLKEILNFTELFYSDANLKVPQGWILTFLIRVHWKIARCFFLAHGAVILHRSKAVLISSN